MIFVKYVNFEKQKLEFKSHHILGSNEIINVKEIMKFLPKLNKNQILKIFVEPSSAHCLKLEKDENGRNGIQALKVSINSPL